MRICLVVFSALLLATLLAAPAVADDIVWLKSGDRITGKIVKKDGDNLIVKAEYGEVKIPLKDIRSFKSDRPLEITLKDGKEHIGPVDGSAEEDLTIREKDNTEFKVPDLATIEKIEDPSVEPDYWTGKFYASANVEDGNTQKKQYHVDGIIVGDWEKYRLTIEGAYNYGKENGDLTDHDAYGQIKFDYFLADRFYLYGKSRIKHDKFQDIRYRWSTGPGVGYQWLKEKGHYLLETEAGASWTRDDRMGGLKNEGYVSADIAARGHWVIVDGLRASFESLWGFNLEDSHDYFGRTWVALDLTIIKNLALTGKIINEYENFTSPGTEHNDWYYLLGITWTAF